MKRAWIIASFTSIMVAGGFAQTKKDSKAARQELGEPPVAAAVASSNSAHPSPYNFPGVQYPRIEADTRVTFHFTAPNAQKVQVSIVNTPFDMVKGPDGVWTYTSAPQAAGVSQLLDDRGWSDGAGPGHASLHWLWPYVQRLRNSRAGRGLV